MAEEHKIIGLVEVTDDGVHLIHLKGVIDASTVEEFEQVLEFLISQNYFKFIIDLGQVEFISSAGWGIFVGELKCVRENAGDIILVDMQPDVFDVFLLLELDTIMQAFPTIEEGLRRMGSSIPAGEASPTKEEDDPALRENGAASGGSDSIAESGIHISIRKRGTARKDIAADQIRESEAEGAAEIGQSAEANDAMQDSPRVSQAAAASQDTSLDADEHESEEETAEFRKMPEPRDDDADPWMGDEPQEGGAKSDSGEATQVAPEPSGQDGLNGPQQAGEAVSRKKQPEKSLEASFGWNYDPKKDADDLASLNTSYRGDRGYQYGAVGYTAHEDEEGWLTLEEEEVELPELPDFADDPLLEKIISVVIARPSFGPSSIRDMLIRMELADESLTRSMVYRKLAAVNLNTRAKRIAFARANVL